MAETGEIATEKDVWYNFKVDALNPDRNSFGLGPSNKYATREKVFQYGLTTSSSFEGFKLTRISDIKVTDSGSFTCTDPYKKISTAFGLGTSGRLFIRVILTDTSLKGVFPLDNYLFNTYNTTNSYGYADSALLSYCYGSVDSRFGDEFTRGTDGYGHDTYKLSSITIFSRSANSLKIPYNLAKQVGTDLVDSYLGNIPRDLIIIIFSTDSSGFTPLKFKVFHQHKFEGAGAAFTQFEDAFGGDFGTPEGDITGVKSYSDGSFPWYISHACTSKYSFNYVDNKSTPSACYIDKNTVDKILRGDSYTLDWRLFTDYLG